MENKFTDSQNYWNTLNLDMEIFKIFSIEAARSLPNLPDKHPCKNIHGHSFKIIISVKGDIDKKTGFVMDFNDIDIAFEPILKMIDHSYLNNLKGLENPSSENLSRWIWKKLIKTLPSLSKIEIRETESTGCVYKGL